MHAFPRRAPGLALILAIAASFFIAVRAAATGPGDPAPDVALVDVTNHPRSLTEFLGRVAVVEFADWA